MDAYHYFYRSDGTPRTRLLNPTYAETLDIIAKDPASFYRGSLAEAMVAAAAAPPRPGSLNLADLAGYKAMKRSPLCIDYRRRQVCGPPPASSWVGIGMMLGLLEQNRFSLGGSTRRLGADHRGPTPSLCRSRSLCCRRSGRFGTTQGPVG